MGLVPLFQEGFQLVRRYRQTRRDRAAASRLTAELESETESGGTAVTDRYEGFHAAYGERVCARGTVVTPLSVMSCRIHYQNPDIFFFRLGIARESLIALVIQLQQGL